VGGGGGSLMSRHALLDLLPDFGAGGRPRLPELPVAGAEPAAPAEDPQQAAIDVGAIVAEEVAKTEASVTERLTAIYEATLQAERDNHAAERDALRQSLGAEAAALIEMRFAAMEAGLTVLTTSATARILANLLTAEVQKRAIAALSARIGEAIRDGEAVRIRATGPQLLCEALAAALGEHAASVEFGERASFDLAVNVDSSIYETRLADWASDLEGILA
jgi:hypothetical protein